MNTSCLSAFCQLKSPVFRTMRQLAVLLTLLCLAIPGPALAGNGNGKGNDNGNGNGNSQAQSNNGNGNGNANGKGNDNGNPNGNGNSNANSPDTPSAPNPVSGTVLSPEGAAAASDQNLALKAVQDGSALPLSEIAKRVRHLFGARILDAHLVRNSKALVYRLTILTDQGVSKKIEMDAKAGMTIGVD